MKTPYKITYSIVGALLVPCFMRLNIHGTGLEGDMTKYIVPFFVGLGGGYLIGLMKDRWISLIKDQEEIIAERTAELQTALSEIKTLQGILPICSFCKKVRDDNGYWQQVDVYIKNHSDADFSHGICPECISKHYPDIKQDDAETS